MTPRRLKSPACRGYRANASANSREAPDRSPFSMADWMDSIARSTSRFWLRRGNRAQSNTPASAATRIGPIVSQRLRRLDQLDFEGDLDLVAHHHAAGFEHRIVGQAKVLAAELCYGFGAPARVAPRIFDFRCRTGHVQGHLVRCAANRQIARDLVTLRAVRFDLLRLELDRGIVRGIEEVRALQVLIPVGLAGVNRIDIDLGRNAGSRRIGRVDRHRAADFAELATHIGDHQVPHLEMRARVSRLDRVGGGHRGRRRRRTHEESPLNTDANSFPQDSDPAQAPPHPTQGPIRQSACPFDRAPLGRDTKEMLPSMPVAALHVRNLRKTFKDVVAVDGLELEVRTGECFGLLGPNGAGKTTTIEICEGLTEPDSGEVELLGMRWKSNAAELRQRLGIQLQETQLADKVTVLETIRLFRSFFRHGPNAVRGDRAGAA